MRFVRDRLVISLFTHGDGGAGNGGPSRPAEAPQFLQNTFDVAGNTLWAAPCHCIFIRHHNGLAKALDARPCGIASPLCRRTD